LNNLNALLLLGKIYFKLFEFEKALNFFLLSDTLSNGTDSEIKNIIGLIYYKNKRFSDSSNYFADAVNYEINSLVYKFNLVKLKKINLGS